MAKDDGGSGEAADKVLPDQAASLSETLASAREQRKLSVAQAAAEAHVPIHYVKMLEAGDYTLISDSLYLLPFLRRYASFLALDPDELAMRFVRDAQGAESYPIKIPDAAPVPGARRMRTGWLTSVAVALIVLLALYLAGVGRHRAAERDSGDTPAQTKPNS